MAYDSNRGTARLAQAIQQRMERTMDMPMQLDFGTINDDLSLQTNSFEKPIPVDDYEVIELWGGKPLKTHDPNTAHNSGWIPEPAWWWPPVLQPGNRVLVAWVGSEAVVLGRLKNAAEIEWDV